MGMHAQGNVTFPFDAALELARALWKAGTDIGVSYQPARVATAKVALEGWQGTFAQTFSGNMNTSSSEASGLQSSLCSAANGLAAQWVEAHTEQGRIDHAKLVDKARSDRSWGTKVVDSLAGDSTNYGNPPPAPAQPAPPGFAATPVTPATLH
ncbi:MAG: hypothetical protein M3063_12310 [Actinomycetota bacterium]|nr:hypothetical protein [Actinomycetota bacterium]